MLKNIVILFVVCVLAFGLVGCDVDHRDIVSCPENTPDYSFSGMSQDGESCLFWDMNKNEMILVALGDDLPEN